MAHSDSQSGMQPMAAEVGGSRLMHPDTRTNIIASIQESLR